MMSDIAPIGHNRPPDEFAEITTEINDLYQTAKDFNDGEPLVAQGQADQIIKLIKLMKVSAKRAESHRKELVIPIDEAKQAVQDKFNPLIGKAKEDGSRGVIVRALEVCTELLTPWNNKIQAAKDEEARKAREIADAKQLEAQKAIRAANLEEREEAEKLIVEANKAKAKANAIAKDNVKGMRTVWDVDVTDYVALLRHYFQTRPDKLKGTVYQMAEQDIRAGIRTIPGCNITSRKVAK